MEALTTRQAAERSGLTVPKFHKVAARHNISPVFEAPGLRGAKFWNPRDVDRLAEQIHAEIAGLA